jgi:hypothetical protein
VQPIRRTAFDVGNLRTLTPVDPVTREAASEQSDAHH